MSQVLEKPILLDETGQAIAGKLDTNSAAIIEALDDIKDAIGTSSEFIPVKIQVVTPPTKTIYKVGERLNLSGMVVNLVGTNGVQIDVTSACTFSPANGTALTTSDTAVTVTYLYQHDNTTFTTSQALTIRELSSITVTTPPTKTAYQTGEALDLTGIVVTATYSDGSTENVTTDCTFNPANGATLSSSDTSVTASFTEGGVTKTATTPISIRGLLSIAVTTPPTKTLYKIGETLNLTGMVVTATYDDNTTADVTSNCVFSPANGATLTSNDTSVSVSYTEGSVTKTAMQALTIVVLDSIAVTNPPTTTTYLAGDTLNLAGIEVTATYTDNSTADVTASCVFSPANGATLAKSDSNMSVSYTENGITKTTTQHLSIKAAMYAFENATEQQLADMIESYYDGSYDASDVQTLLTTYLPIGAKRTLHIDHMDAEYVSESHFGSDGADYAFIIVGHRHDSLKTPINGKTEALLTINQERLLYTNTTSSSEDDRTIAKGFGYMNSTDTNIGGWKDCVRREWCNDTYFNALPQYIQSLIKTVIKKSYEYDSTSGNPHYTETEDEIFLFNEIEISNGYSDSTGFSYDYFRTSNSSRIKKKPYYSSGNDGPIYWLRDAYHGNYADSHSKFNTVYSSSGSPTILQVNASAINTGITPSFCL